MELALWNRVVKPKVSNRSCAIEFDEPELPETLNKERCASQCNISLDIAD